MYDLSFSRSSIADLTYPHPTDIHSLAAPFHELDLRYLNPLYVASVNDSMPVWLIHAVSALHLLLVLQVESELVLSVELVSALLL